MILVAGLATPMARAQEAAPASGRGTNSPLTLDAAIQLAREHNPELKSAQSRVSAAAGRANQARAWPNPELELAAEEWPLRQGRGFNDAKQTIGVAQTLPFPGKKSLDRQAGVAGLRISEAQSNLRRTEIVRDVKIAFFNVLAAQGLVSACEELVNVAESSAAAARQRAAAGDTAYQEQLRAEIQSEQAKAELSVLRHQLATARTALAGMIGLPELVDAPLEGTLAETPHAHISDSPDQEWLAGHPSLRAARERLSRARLDSSRARVEPYPDVKVGLAGGRRGETDESIIELRFALPLPLFDRSKGLRQEAAANVETAEAELESVRQQLLGEWARATHHCRAAAAQVESYRDRIVPKAAEALKLVQRGFEEGKFGYIDLLDTQRTLAQARSEYHQKLLAMNVALAELEALLQPESNSPFNPKAKNKP